MIETNYAVATGEYIQEWQEENSVSTPHLAVRLNLSVAEVESILSGSTLVDENISELLERVTDIPARIWLNFEKRYIADLIRLNLERPIRN